MTIAMTIAISITMRIAKTNLKHKFPKQTFLNAVLEI
jgi:hypothetical protein